MLTKRQLARAYALALTQLAADIVEHPDAYFGAEDAPMAEGFDLQVGLERRTTGVVPSVRIRRKTYLPGDDGRRIRTVEW